MVELLNKQEQFSAGNDSIVIRKFLNGVEGGRALDITEYKTMAGTSVVPAGTIIVAKDKVYKPLALASATAYGTLQESHEYVGVTVATIDASREGAGIMTAGSVNKDVMPFGGSGKVTELKAAVPTLEFVTDL